MKTVLLTGSPRRGGNTMALADAFEKRSEKLGNEVIRFDTAFMEIAPCSACLGCRKNDGVCVKDDGFQKIAEAVREADAVVFSTPLYFFTFPAQLKNAVDRFYCLLTDRKAVSGKKCAIMTCCGNPDPSVTDGLILTFRKIVDLFPWINAGEIIIASARTEDYAVSSGLTSKAEELAETLFR